jgi:5-oxoprolinase (ATP-hydrolysing) subunit C
MHRIALCIIILMAMTSIPHSATTDDEGRWSPSAYKLNEVIKVQGRQGVACDRQHYYVSGSKALYKYTKKGKLVASNVEPFKDWAPDLNHLGDIDYYNEEIYAGAEKFSEGRGWDIQIAIFDAKTLKYKRSIPFNKDSGQVEVCGITIDPIRKVAWMADWCNGRYLYQYDLSTEKYIGRTHLFPVPQYQQGIFFYKGDIFITADDGDADQNESDHLYRINANPASTSARVKLERTFNKVTREGEIEGLCFDVSKYQLVVLFNRGTRVVEGIPKGFYPGYDKEISELYVYGLTNAARRAYSERSDRRSR